MATGNLGNTTLANFVLTYGNNIPVYGNGAGNLVYLRNCATPSQIQAALISEYPNVLNANNVLVYGCVVNQANQVGVYDIALAPSVASVLTATPIQLGTNFGTTIGNFTAANMTVGISGLDYANVGSSSQLVETIGGAGLTMYFGDSNSGCMPRDLPGNQHLPLAGEHRRLDVRGQRRSGRGPARPASARSRLSSAAPAA